MNLRRLGFVVSLLISIYQPSLLAGKLPDAVAKALVQQVQYELEGANFYLQLAGEFSRQSLDGFGQWYTYQYLEELNHARMIMDFLKKKNVSVPIAVIPAPMPPKASVLENVEDSLATEQVQTERINSLYDLAKAEKARDAETFLQWFVTEQVAEEDLFNNLRDKVLLTMSNNQSILTLDQQLKARPQPVIFMPVTQ